MSDDPPNFEERRRRRGEDASTVRCAWCKRWIMATATQCRECGVHFPGEAQDFADDTKERGGAPTGVIVVAVLLLPAMLVGGLR